MSWGISETEWRDVAALSFEPMEDGYIYYRSAWARGITVTTEERQAFLDIPLNGSRHTWHSSLAGRPTVPPRPYFPQVRKMLTAMPTFIVALPGAIGAVLIWRGVFQESLGLIIFGGLLLLYAGAVLLVRIVEQRSDNG